MIIPICKFTDVVKRCVFIIFLVTNLNMIGNAQTISQSEAIQAVKKYISKDTSLKFKNLLYPDVYGADFDTGNERGNWTVSFCSKNTAKHGFSFSVSNDGKKISFNPVLISLGRVENIINSCPNDPFIDFPSSPAKIGYSPLGAYYTVENYSINDLVGYRLGCVELSEKTLPKITKKLKKEYFFLAGKSKDTDSINFKYIKTLEAQKRCDLENEKIGFIELFYSDNFTWMLQNKK